MRTFLELKQKLTLEEIGNEIQAQEIKILVSDKAEAISKLSLFEPSFAGMEYTRQVHYCNHPDGSCEVEEI